MHRKSFFISGLFEFVHNESDDVRLNKVHFGVSDNKPCNRHRINDGGEKETKKQPLLCLGSQVLNTILAAKLS